MKKSGVATLSFGSGLAIVSKRWQFCSSNVACVFGRDDISRWALLSIWYLCQEQYKTSHWQMANSVD